MSSGGGGSVKQQVADYFLGLHYGICTEVDSINYMQIDDNKIDLNVTSNQTITLNQQGLFGGRTKNGGIGGKIDFMMGRPDQKITAAFAARLGGTPDTLPGFRGISSAYFYDGNSGQFQRPGFYWCSNQAYLKAVAFNVTRHARGVNGIISALADGTTNAVNIIYECLVNREWGMSCPISLIDVPSFEAAAAACAAEGFGLSLLWSRSDTIRNFISEILDTIQATLAVNPRTGKLRLKLLRNDYDTANLPIVYPGNAKITKWQAKSWGETVNEINVSWTNPENEQSETVTYQNLANEAIQGAVVSDTRNYYGVRNQALALRLARRDLLQSSAPLRSIEVTTNRIAWDWMPGDVVDLRWPAYGIGSVIMRIVSIDYGTVDNSVIRVGLLEDIFRYGTALYVDPPSDNPNPPAPNPGPPPEPPYEPPPYVPPTDPGTGQPPITPPEDELPRVADHVYLDSAPYFLLAATGSDATAQAIEWPTTAALVLASQNGSGTRAIGYWPEVTDALGNTSFQQTASLPVQGYTTLKAAVPAQVNTTLSTATNINALVGRPLAASLLVTFIDPNDPSKMEVGAIQVVNSDGSFLVRRGMLDTYPHEWPVGTQVWLYEISTDSMDTMNRASGSTLRLRLTPRTAKGELSAEASPIYQETVFDRLHLPYRPANVQINGEPFDDLPLPPGTNVEVTWARRNRLTETAQLLRWNDADVPPEVGQTTVLTIRNSEGVVTTRIDGITGTTYTLTPAQIAAGRGDGDYMTLTVESEREHDVAGPITSLQGMVRKLDIASWPTSAGWGRAWGKAWGG